MNLAFRLTPDFTEVTAGGSRLPVAEFRLGGVPRGAVLALCDKGGLETASAELLQEFGLHGYEGLVADPTAVDGDPLDSQEVIDLLLRRLAGRNWTADQVGAVGYGTGATVALEAAVNFAFGAVVSVSPAGLTGTDGPRNKSLEDRAARLQSPWLGLFGGDDPASPATLVWSWGRTLSERSPVFTQVVTYPGVSAKFFRDDHSDGEFPAWFDSRQRTLEWFNTRVVPRPTPLALQWQRRQGDTSQPLRPTGT